MNHFDLLREFSSTLQIQTNRAFRLDWGQSHRDLEKSLIVQRVDVTEALCSGIEGHLTCLSMNADLPLKSLIGLPLTLKIVTDRGALHAISGIITDARAGQSDGSLTCYQLTMRDALTVLTGRINRRVFRQKSILDVIAVLLNEWRKKSTTFAGTFDIDFSALTYSKYPVREMIRQHDESDAAFIQRLLRREGVSWFIAAGKLGSAPSDQSTDPIPMHTLVLFDDPMALPQCAAGTVRYHQDTATEARDSITHWSAWQQIVPAGVERSSWDYKIGRVDRKRVSGNTDQGDAGNDLGRLLVDGAIDTPHAANSSADYDRISQARMLAHDARAYKIDGVSGVRNLAVGRWFALTEHPQVDKLPANQRQFIVTNLHHRGENNLPKELNERAQALFAANRWQFDDVSCGIQTPTSSSPESETRYENTFGCVTRGIPLTPIYDPRIDLPRVYPITGIVVGPAGETVYCDEMGRVRVQIQGMNPGDHAHAKGAGTSGTDLDSAWVRMSGSWAGSNFGVNMPLRAGMEVILDFMNGDPDKMFISGVMQGQLNMPATFSNTGGLPGNRYVSGIKSQEIKGGGFNQLRLDDTSSQVSAQLASTHAASELNLGYLTHPRTNGQGADRGEGAELRTDAAAALRAAKGILLTTYARSQAAGKLLDRDELDQLLGECTELFKTLGGYVSQHGGQAADATGQTNLANGMKGWDAGSDSGATAGSGNAQALMVSGAEAGAIHLTPKTHLTYAGENIDQVAQQHMQLVSGQRLDATAGNGMQWFARGKTGIQAIANEGPMLLQAQADILTASAQKGIHLSTNENEVLVTGQTIRMVAEDGSYVKIGGGGITLGTPGDVKILSASHQWGGPSSDQAAKTAFNKLPTDQRFRLHHRGEIDSSDTPDGPALAANQSYRITKDDGSVVESKSDAGGLSDLAKNEVMSLLQIDILKPTL